MHTTTQAADNQHDSLPLEHVHSDAPLMSSRGRGWSGMTVEHFHVPPREIVYPPLSEHILVYVLAPAVHLVQHRDERMRKGTLLPGDVLVLPAHAPSVFRWSGEANVVHVRLEPGFVARIAEASALDPARIEGRHACGTPDRQIEQLSLALRDELANGGLGQHLYIESLAPAATIHLLRTFTNVAPLPVHVPGQRDQRQLQEVRAFIDDPLDHNLHLVDLAASVGLSPYHFSRVFKRTTGQSPHQYLLARHIERAKLLLATTNLPIADVALRVGFTDQSHLTYHLKRLLGVTPRQVRHTARM